MANTSTLDRLLSKLGPVLGASLLLFAGSTVGFLIFGMLAGGIDLFNASLETIVRVVLALVSLVVAQYLFMGKNVLILTGWPILMAIMQFLVYPSEILTVSGFSWKGLVDLGSAGISGYQSINLLIDFSLVFALIVAIAFRKRILQQVVKGSFDSMLIEFLGDYKKRFLGSGFFTRLAGIALITWAVIGIVVLVIGISSGLVSLTNGSWDGLVTLIIALGAIYLTLRSGWKWSRIAWLVGIAAVWFFGLGTIVLSYSFPDSGLGGLYFDPAITAFRTVEVLAMLVAVVSVVFVLAKSLIQAYATRVQSWIDTRMAELYEDDMARKAPVEPRTTSLMAVFSLIFALVFPFVGLILAHSARNEIAISRGTKYGTEMTIAAAVISWVFIGAYVVLFLALFVFLPLLGIGDLAYLLGGGF
jgi:hypothetical protein